MTEHTHNLSQYATFFDKSGRILQLWKRPKKNGQKYSSPVFAGLEKFRSRKEAWDFKKQYDA